MHLSYFVKNNGNSYSWHISKKRYFRNLSIQHIPKNFYIYLQWECSYYFTRNSPIVKLKSNKEKKYALVLTYWHTSIVFYLKHRR